MVPRLTKNLLSISKLTSDYPVKIVFTNNSFAIQNRKTGEIMAQGKCENGLYVLERAHKLLWRPYAPRNYVVPMNFGIRD